MALKISGSKTQMTDVSKENLEDLGETVRQVTDRFGTTIPEIQKLVDVFKKVEKESGRFSEVTRKSSEVFANALVSIGKDIRRGEASYADQRRLLKQLNNAIEDATDANADSAEVQKLINQKKELAEKAHQQNIQEQFQEGGKALGEATRAISAHVVTGAGDFVKGLQAGQSGTELSAGLLNTALDAAGAGAGAVFKGMTSLGTALSSSVNPGVALFGAGLAAVSEGLNAAKDATIQLVKSGFQIAKAEVEKTVKAFHDVSASGALFARGMDDIRVYSGRAGLTLTEFSDVIKGNAQNLAAAGYTVSDGAKIVGNVTSQFPKLVGKSGLSLQREMQNLGYSFKEQADLTTMVIADLKRTGGTATNQQVAEATAEVAKNLRVVADITGEDAKQKMDQAKKDAEQYAFNQKVNEIARRTNDPGLPKRVEQSLAMMDATQRRAAIQAVALNGAVTDVSANLTGAVAPAQQFARTLEGGHASLRDMARPFAQQGDKMLAGANDTGEAISRTAIATGKLADTAAAFDSLNQQSYKLNSKNLDKAVENAEKGAEAAGDLQNNVMDAEKAAHDMAVAMERDLTPAIKKFSELSLGMLRFVEDKLDELGLGGSLPEKKDRAIARYEAASEKERTINAEENVGILGQLFGIGLSDEAARARDERIQAQRRREIYDKDFKKELKYEEYAVGGIATGPTTGFPAMLHGTEAVVPLPDGKTIPVNINAQDRGEKDRSGSVSPDQTSASIKNITSDNKPIPIQLALSYQKDFEMLPGLKSFSGYNQGPISTDLNIVAELAKRLGAYDEQNKIITDPDTWKQLLSYGFDFNAGVQRTNILGTFGTPQSDIAPTIDVADFQEKLNAIAEEIKIKRAAGERFETPEDAAKKMYGEEGFKAMMESMKELVAYMKDQNTATQNLVKEAQRGNRTSREILQASY
jgi:hypothetical protein